jgi:hypothetical protein
MASDCHRESGGCRLVGMTPLAPLSRAAGHRCSASPVRLVHLGLGNLFRAHQADVIGSVSRAHAADDHDAWLG